MHIIVSGSEQIRQKFANISCVGGRTKCPHLYRRVRNRGTAPDLNVNTEGAALQGKTVMSKRCAGGLLDSEQGRGIKAQTGKRLIKELGMKQEIREDMRTRTIV